MNANGPCRRLRFGAFEADFQTGELTRHGCRIKLSGQPFQILEILLARPGQLVTRAELENLLWPGQMFGDSAHGLNAAVNKLRDALNDSAANPKYIETLSRRGYRFIGTLEPLALPESPSELPSPAVLAPAQAANRTVWTPIERVRALLSRSSPLPLGIRASLAASLIGLFALLMQFDVRPTRAPVAENVQPALAEEALIRQPVAAANEEAIKLAVERRRSPQTIFRPVSWNEGGNAGPQFSPDGKHIAFMSNRNGPWQIWVSNVDGSEPRQVSFTQSAGTPRWSPDGRSIAFDAPFHSSIWIYVVNVEQHREARPIVEGLVPSFSRDGAWIYYASDRTGDWQVWKTGAAAEPQVQVTFGGGFAALESTDGYIYYSKSKNPEPEICRVSVNGGEESCGLQRVRPRTWASWAVTRNGIVFAEDRPNGQAELSLYDPSRRQVRELAVLQSAPFWLGASLDGKRAIMNDASEQQISMLENLN